MQIIAWVQAAFSALWAGQVERHVAKRSETSVNVLIATPFGSGGRGGIDRLMDALRDGTRDDRFEGCQLWFGATRGPVPLLLSPIYFVLFCLRMTILRLLGRLDVLHLNLAAHGSAHRKAALGRFASWLGVPYVIHLHGSRFRSFLGAASPATRAKMRLFFGDAGRVVVLGRVWRDYVADNLPEARDRIVVLPNATGAFTTPRSRTPRERVRILFLGQLGERKGVRDLVSALDGLRDLEGWDAVIAGDGEVEDTRRRVSELALASRVTLPGWVDVEQARALLADADILVLPSYDENLPMSVIEGMSAGLAVITTPVGAVEDIIQDDVTGLLVPPGDVAALSAGLRRLVSDKPLRDRLGAAAVAFHREHLEIGAYDRRIAQIWRAAAGR